MANPTQIALVTANGQKYDAWETIEVTRSANSPVFDHAMLTVTEPSSGATTLSQLKLQPGDAATVSLAGKQTINGAVYLRQGAVDASAHVVQIGIMSRAQAVAVSTVDANPGQYKNQTLQQIGTVVFGKVGVAWNVTAPNADTPFPRVSEHVGETRFCFIERLCRMQNVHMIDDGNGGIIGFRGPLATSSPAATQAAPKRVIITGGTVVGGPQQQIPMTNLVLQEGVNIKSGRVLLKNNEMVTDIGIYGSNYGQNSADMNRQTYGHSTISPSVPNRPFSLLAEEMGPNPLMQNRANHQADWLRFYNVDGDITVQGWLAPDGDLWFNKVRQLVTLNAPTLLPNNSFQFMIKGVTHKQSNAEGTTTTIMLCRADGFGINGVLPLQQQQQSGQ